MCSNKLHKIHKKSIDNEAFFKNIASGNPVSLLRKDSIADVFLEVKKYP